MMTPEVVLIRFILKYRNIFNFADSFSLEWHSMNTPVKIIEKNDRSNAVLGVRTLQNRSNGLNDVLIPKLNTVIVLNDVRSLKKDGTTV